MATYKKYKTSTGKIFWEALVDLGRDELTDARIRPHKKGFLTKKDAELWVANKQINFDKTGVYGNTQLTFELLYKQWMHDDYQNRVRESTWTKTADNFRLHILPDFKDQYAQKISVSYCQKIVNKWFKDDHLKQYLRFRSYVISVFNFGIRMEKITRNPMEKTSIPKNKNHFDKVKLNFYEKEELTRYLDCAKANGNPELFMFFRLLSYSGLRKGEALALRFSDINFETHEISITKTLSQGEDGRLMIDPPKTASSVRTITVDDKTMTYLRNWKDELLRNMMYLGLSVRDPNEQLIFPNRRNTLAQPSLPTHWNDTICHNYHLRHITVHEFRHTFCSLSAASGANLNDIAKMLGHSDPKITMQIYLHTVKKRKLEVNQKFVDFMDS